MFSIECTLILLRSERNRILDNLEFISKNNIKINLLCHISKNGWKDAFVLIEQKAIRQNELNELIQISIKSQCLTYASSLIRTNFLSIYSHWHFTTGIRIYAKN
ncbi:hypothetical protein BLA29_010182 [Euroglyphus maynei]|uniref:Uncharacterized protein n=1 Tax=Euroglyphus maynei TaxID=6958 RepID=A0A1Y3AWN3_EURMA|nr:hypothetical protein BLA29_010182 [Euroglyphus maynei]